MRPKCIYFLKFRPPWFEISEKPSYHQPLIFLELLYMCIIFQPCNLVMEKLCINTHESKLGLWNIWPELNLPFSFKNSTILYLTALNNICCTQSYIIDLMMSTVFIWVNCYCIDKTISHTQLVHSKQHMCHIFIVQNTWILNIE